MEIEVFSSLVTTVGFPIAVTGFLLYERMRRDEKLERAVEAMTLAVNEMQILLKEVRR